MWWVLVPRSTVTCTVSLAVLATARRNSSSRSESKSATRLGGQVALEHARTGRPETSIAARGARLVHRHHGVAVAADARRGRPAPRPVRGPARCRCPPPCGGARSPGRRPPSRPGPARPWRASASSRWSKKPTPVERVARRRRRRAPATGGCRSRWWCGRCLRCGSCAALHGLGVDGEALGAGEGGAGRGQARCRRPRETIRAPSGAGRWTPTAPTGSARRRRWAARGWSRPRSRRTPWRRRAPTNRQPARRTSPASASASAPTSSRCSGASSSASAAPRGRPRGDRSSAAATLGRSAASRSTTRDRVEQLLRRSAITASSSSGPCSAWAQQVERHQLGVGARRRPPPPARSGPAMPSMPTWPTTWRLASCT